MHAQESCAGTRFLCMHKNLVHAQESGACRRILRVQKNLVHALDFCDSAAIANKIDAFCQSTFFHEWAPYGRWEGHRIADIRVVAMRIFFIFMMSQKKLVFQPVDVS